MSEGQLNSVGLSNLTYICKEYYHTSADGHNTYYVKALLAIVLLLATNS